MYHSPVFDFLILSITFGSGLVIVGYEDHARMKGWPVGEWFSGDAPPLKILAFTAMIVSLGMSFYFYHWWSPAVILALGSGIGFCASRALAFRVQGAALAGVLVGLILCFSSIL